MGGKVGCRMMIQAKQYNIVCTRDIMTLASRTYFTSWFVFWEDSCDRILGLVCMMCVLETCVHWLEQS